jgi:hypothetical protein
MLASGTTDPERWEFSHRRTPLQNFLLAPSSLISFEMNSCSGTFKHAITGRRRRFVSLGQGEDTPMEKAFRLGTL